jgi:Low molecular weight phosphotyrosine protein phosphatase
LAPRFLAAIRRKPDAGTVANSLFEILQQRRGRVLFVSEKNASRSQMAEAFARSLGGDVLEAASGGGSPAACIPQQTCAVMQEKGVPIGPYQSPKNFDSFTLADFDVIVNLGGCKLPETEVTVLDLPLPTPFDDLSSHREARERVETFVNFLVDHFRRAKEWSSGVEQASSPKIDASQTSPAPPAATPQPDAAMIAAS